MNISKNGARFVKAVLVAQLLMAPGTLAAEEHVDTRNCKFIHIEEETSSGRALDALEVAERRFAKERARHDSTWVFTKRKGAFASPDSNGVSKGCKPRLQGKIEIWTCTIRVKLCKKKSKI